MKGPVKVGTRISRLARWQTDHVIAQLQAAWPDLQVSVQTFTTKGDQDLDKPLPAIGGKGLFTAALEEALRSGEIDIAVHSLKDLPVVDPPGLIVGAIIGRADVRDALVSRSGLTLQSLPEGAVVGTSSLRRQAQLLAARPDLCIRSIRGNVETRIRKVLDGDYDAAVMAVAGLQRLELEQHAGFYFSPDEMLPAPGQGALAVQCRAADEQVLALLEAVDNESVRAAVTAERTFLHALGGGCAVPVAALARAENGAWRLDGLVADPAGAPLVRVGSSGADPEKLGRDLAAQAVNAGAMRILDRVKPLRNKRVVVTRGAQQAGSFARQLDALGAEAIIFPVISFEVRDASDFYPYLRELDAYSWLIFTSANAVRFFFQIYGDNPNPAALPRISALGKATAEELAQYGLTPDFVPEVFTGEALAVGLGDLTGRRVLLPRAHKGRPETVKALSEQGAEVDDVPLYETITAVPAPEAMAEIRRGADVVTFTSPSSVRNFRKILNEAAIDADAYLAKVQIVCIGPSTAAQLQEFGRSADLVPVEYTIDGMIEAMINN